MAKYNIYQIPKKNETSLLEKLTSVRLIKANTLTSGSFEISFYYSETPDKIPIWWTKLYEDFLDESSDIKNIAYFAVVIISNSSSCYAISLGKSHFYLKPFCNEDFGMELAERIADQGSIKIKNSKFFKSRRSKAIISYQDNNEIEYDSGESLHYIKAKSIDASAWGINISFGNSVQFCLDIEPKKMGHFIMAIEKELLKPRLFQVPRLEKVTDKDLQRILDQKLCNSILRKDSSSSLMIEEFSISGVEFVFTEFSSYKLYIKGQRNRIEFPELNLNNLREFIKGSPIDLFEKINDIKVEVTKDDAKTITFPIKKFLDYIIEDDGYCLFDGQWYKFNQSYIDFLEKEINGITYTYDEKYNTLIAGATDENDFNKTMVSEGYFCCDRVLEMIDRKYRIEKMDLYKDNTLYFVKFGKLQGLGYVIDQSTNTIKYLQNNLGNIVINGEKKEIKTMCLWIALERRTKIKKLSDIRSLIFLMKLCEWKKVCKDAGYNAQIKINYIFD